MSIRRLLPVLFVLLAPRLALAWGNHTLGTWPALEAQPAVKNAAPVKAESLEAFLQAEQKGLATLLKDEESWARQHVPEYPARPDALEFKDGGTTAELRARFLEAIRINPASKLPLFLQPLPGTDISGKALIPGDQVTTLKDQKAVNVITFIAVQEGQEVAPLEVAATAADEPDYGLDLGLFEDNGTEHGKRYGFGKQPFGNPKLEFGTQAPFHMGFYHESGIIYKAASFLKRTYPEFRLHLYQSLARYAFKTGHAYWGWRFAGWGLHYVGDLTQPYHSTVLPGISTIRMLWINTIDLIGIHKPKNNAVSLVSNRHLALENYQYNQMNDAWARRDMSNVILVAMSTGKLPDGKTAPADSSYGPWNDRYPRDVLTVESHDRARKVDDALEDYLPERLVDDPDYVMEQTEPDIDVYKLLADKPEARKDMDGLLAPLMASFAAHSRNYLTAASAP